MTIVQEIIVFLCLIYISHSIRYLVNVAKSKECDIADCINCECCKDCTATVCKKEAKK